MKNRLLATLLLTLPSMVAMVPTVAHSARTIAVTLSRSAMVPEQVAMQVGERVRLNVTSADGARVCHVKGLRVDVRIPAGGAALALDITPTQPGVFPIECIDHGDDNRVRTTGQFVVKPE